MPLFPAFRISRTARTALIFLAVVVCVLVLQRVPVVGAVFSVAGRSLVAAGTSMGNVVARVTTPEDSLHALLAACEDRLLASTAREAQLAAAERRATELEALLGYVESTGVNGVTAHVTARSLPEEATVRIDRGARDGIREGDAVVIAEGHLFGIVVRTSERAADVALVHHRDSRVPAMVLGRSRTVGLVSGQEGSLLHMDFIPQDANVEEGQTVVTSGLEGALPPNLVIGVVTSVLREETAPFLAALVEPLYDSREWTVVLVVSVPL